jgi:glycosyltransferase involved in cell wall biosynthesis
VGLRILHIQRVKSLAGSEKWLADILPKLEERDIYCDLVIVCRKEERKGIQSFVDLLLKKNVRHYILISQGDIRLRLLKQIYSIYQENNFDAIHCHLLHADVWVATIKKYWDKNITMFSTVHGYDEQHQKLHGLSLNNKPARGRYFRLAKYALKQANRIHCVSFGLKAFFSTNSLADKTKLEVFQHGLDTPKSDKYCNYDSKTILIVGRVIPYKGQALCIESFRSVVDKYPDVKLLIVGGGEEGYISDLKKLTKDLNLEFNVSFEGFQSDVSIYYENASILVVPSIGEGFGMVFLEGMLHGLPVIAFDVPAANEIIEQNQTGFLVKPYDINELSSRIIDLLESKSKMVSFGEMGQSLVKNKFNLNRQADELSNWYKQECVG